MTHLPDMTGLSLKPGQMMHIHLTFRASKVSLTTLTAARYLSDLDDMPPPAAPAVPAVRVSQ